MIRVSISYQTDRYRHTGRYILNKERRGGASFSRAGRRSSTSSSRASLAGRRGGTSFLRGEKRRRLVPRMETLVSMVPRDSERSTYQYPVGPLHTAHTGRYSLK
ncbi:hypothetical protein GW17_00023573 [Ensete ventricosum]|nr:hypothetical protein GW17_00023573 [Ensete ventricosum]RZS05690.1 hypothetical protein BHM03_00036233 [Ensete ventricosum]